MVRNRVLRTGDGSHAYSKEATDNSIGEASSERDVEHFWGWNDEMMTQEDKNFATIYNKTES